MKHLIYVVLYLRWTGYNWTSDGLMYRYIQLVTIVTIVSIQM